MTMSASPDTATKCASKHRHAQPNPFAPHLWHLHKCTEQWTMGSKPHVHPLATTTTNSSLVGYSPTRDQCIALCNPNKPK